MNDTEYDFGVIAATVGSYMSFSTGGALTLMARDYKDPQIICCQNTGQGWWNQSGVAQTLRTPCGGDSTKANLVIEPNAQENDDEPCVYPGVGITSKENASNPQPGDPTPTISTDSRNYLVKAGKPPRQYIVRRLTPLECCRLQGFPDWWENGVEGSDSARYKMWGNGVSLPTVVDVIGRIAKELRR